MKGLRILGITALVGGVAWYISYMISMSQKLVYGYKNIKFGQFKNGKLILKLDLTIKNTTELDVNVRGVDLDILANDVFISRIFSNIEVSIKPFQTASVPIAVQLSPKDIVANWRDIMFGAGELTNMQLTLKGKIKVRKFGVPIPIPFKYTSALKEMM